MKKIILLLVILFFVGFESYGQCTDIGYTPCGPNHECIPRDQCLNPNPPPPGLVVPIDNNIFFLLAAGLGLGVYFFVSTGRKSAPAP